MPRIVSEVVRCVETPRGAVYFGLSTGETVKRTLAGPFACLTCLRADCRHAAVARADFDRRCATGLLATSRPSVPSGSAA
jgi:hypothetical protein